MSILALYEKQCSCLEGIAFAIDASRARSGDDEQPLIRAAMTVARTSFGIFGRDRHRGSLRSLVAEHDMEALAKPQMPLLHTRPFADNRNAFVDLKFNRKRQPQNRHRPTN
jgi:hypothetical protein